MKAWGRASVPRRHGAAGQSGSDHCRRHPPRRPAPRSPGRANPCRGSPALQGAPGGARKAATGGSPLGAFASFHSARWTCSVPLARSAPAAGVKQSDRWAAPQVPGA